MDIKNAVYINPYTFQATSKRFTNVENRREICEFMRNETLFTPISLEDLMGGMGKPLNLAEGTSSWQERIFTAGKEILFKIIRETWKNNGQHVLLAVLMLIK